MKKSLTYFAVYEALGKRGCPVCRLMEDHSLRYLEALFYEQVNDVGTRRKLRSARGFCNWHGWQATRIATSALGVAIIARDLLTEDLMRFQDLVQARSPRTARRPFSDRIPHRSLGAFLRGWRQKEICPACQIMLDHERHALETILDVLHEPDFADRFEASAGLCRVHLARAAEGHGLHPQFRRLIEIHSRKYSRLVEELEEFCRRHDYRFSREPWGAEADAWLRAIELLVGKPGVIGNEAHPKVAGPATTRRWAGLIARCLRWIGRTRRPQAIRQPEGEDGRNGRIACREPEGG